MLQDVGAGPLAELLAPPPRRSKSANRASTLALWSSGCSLRHLVTKARSPSEPMISLGEVVASGHLGHPAAKVG